MKGSEKPVMGMYGMCFDEEMQVEFGVKFMGRLLAKLHRHGMIHI